MLSLLAQSKGRQTESLFCVEETITSFSSYTQRPELVDKLSGLFSSLFYDFQQYLLTGKEIHI